MRARQALAILGQRFLEKATVDGFDTIVMGAPELAVEMGCTRATASSALNAAVAAGWLRRMPSRKGSSPRWKLRQLPGARGAVADAHSDLVDALVEGDTDHPFAEVFFAAAHPAIGYGEDATGASVRVGHFAWLVGLCDEGGVDPVEVGMTKRTLAKYRRVWLTAVATSERGDTIRPGLDAWAAAHGSDFLKEAAADAYEAQRQARVAEVEAVRARRAKVRAALDTLLTVHPVPKPDARVEKRNAWVQALAASVAASGVPDEMRADLEKALAGKLRARHYPDHVAAKVAAVVVAGQQVVA